MKGSILLKIKDFFIQYSIVCVLFVSVVVFCFIDPTLVSVRNVRNVFSNLAPLMLACIGVAFCFFSGHMDITSGVISSLAGLITASFVQRVDLAERFFSFAPVSVFLIIPAVVILFSLFGFLYAIVIIKTKIHVRIFTLASIVLLLGISYVYASSYNFDTLEIAEFSEQFVGFGIGYVGKNPAYSVPYTVIFSIVIAILAYVYLKVLKIPLINENNSKSLKDYILLYVPATALFALAGIMIVARNDSATPISSINFSTEAITICLVAGFSLNGRKGHLLSVIITALFYVAFMYCIKFLGWNSYLTIVIQGVLCMGALFLDYYISHKKTTSITEAV